MPAGGAHGLMPGVEIDGPRIIVVGLQDPGPRTARRSGWVTTEKCGSPASDGQGGERTNRCLRAAGERLRQRPVESRRRAGDPPSAARTAGAQRLGVHHAGGVRDRCGASGYRPRWRRLGAPPARRPRRAPARVDRAATGAPGGGGARGQTMGGQDRDIECLLMSPDPSQPGSDAGRSTVVTAETRRGRRPALPPLGTAGATAD